MIILKIDLAKIDKARIKVKGEYKDYEIVLLETPGGKYGDWMATESITREEREAGKKGTILGNGKNVGR